MRVEEWLAWVEGVVAFAILFIVLPVWMFVGGEAAITVFKAMLILIPLGQVINYFNKKIS